MGKKSRKKQAEQTQAPTPKTQKETSGKDSWSKYKIQALAIFLVATLLYINTLQNEYAVDDTIVIVKNTLTTQGFAGIDEIMTTDAFYGFFGENYKFVAGGRYRPLSIVTFAIEYEFFGEAPMLSHFVNVVLYALTCLIVFMVLAELFKQKNLKAFALTVPFVTALIYAAHPIHTEVVANIKGRDEIMGMLGAILSLYCFVKYVKQEDLTWLIGGIIAWVFALFSKENAITFLAVFPLTFYFFTTAKLKHYALTLGPTLLLAVIFVALRQTFTDVGITQDSSEILNNPFIGATLMERYATVSYTFWEYFRLLFFPHPLTYDYYYNQVPIVDWSNPIAILSLVLNIAIIGYAIYGFKKKDPIAYGILFYYITISIVSNILFTVGIAMNERFVFMPSLGFALVAAILLMKLTKRFGDKPGNWANQKILLGILAVVMIGYTVKTVTRNTDWKNDFTLFAADVKNSPNSAKVHNAYGGELVAAADRAKSEAQKQEYLKEAVKVLDRALKIYPNYLNAWLLMGNAKYKLNDNVKEAEYYYGKTLALKPSYFEGNFNLGAVYLEHDEPKKAIPYLKTAYASKPQKIEALYNLADAYYKSNMPDSAIATYKTIAELQPNNSIPVYSIGKTYGRVKNDLDNAIIWFNKALEMDPQNTLYYEDLSVAQGMKGDFQSAIRTIERGLQIDATYAAYYRNLSATYYQLGDTAKAQTYQLKYQELTK